MVPNSSPRLPSSRLDSIRARSASTDFRSATILRTARPSISSLKMTLQACTRNAVRFLAIGEVRPSPWYNPRRYSARALNRSIFGGFRPATCSAAVARSRSRSGTRLPFHFNTSLSPATATSTSDPPLATSFARNNLSLSCFHASWVRLNDATARRNLRVSAAVRSSSRDKVRSSWERCLRAAWSAFKAAVRCCSICIRHFRFAM